MVLIFSFSEWTLQVKCERGFRSLLFLMILTFGFTFLKKIKKRRSLYLFIIYILIFCSFASKKNQCFQGFIELYTNKKLCIYQQKTVHIPTKNCAYTNSFICFVGIWWYNKSMKNLSTKSVSSCLSKLTHKGAVFYV